MNFILESLKIKNFKGIKDLNIDFSPTSTTICGANATGKTTIVDAFTWLLFEKDSKGRAQFEIKTLEQGEQLHGLDHTVEGYFKIDGRLMKLKKTYREVWTKKRGEDQPAFTGHEVERVINDIPVKKSEYEKKISQLVDEKIFQLLTDPNYFSQQLSWKDRRSALFSLTGGDITNEDVFEVNAELRTIEDDLVDKTIEDLKKSLSYQRRELNKQRENIPVKIDTLNGTVKQVDKSAIEMRRSLLKGGIKEIEEQMLDITKLNDEQLLKQDKLYNLKSKLKEIEHEVKNSIKDPDIEVQADIRELKLSLRELESDIHDEINTKKGFEDGIDRCNKIIINLREEFTQESSKELELPSNINSCPTCLRDFPKEQIEDKKEELLSNFKLNKAKNLKSIRDQGQRLKNEIERLEKELKISIEVLGDFEKEKQDLLEAINAKESSLGKAEKQDVNDLLANNKEYERIITEAVALQEEIKSHDHSTKINELKARKAQLELELKEKDRELHQDEINQETKAKIKALMAEEKALSKQIIEIEHKENIADKFIHTKAEIIEKTINDKFDKVSFRLFKQQVNGALDETCDVLVDGVPFDNANTAGQVNAGLDVINSLCKHYDIYTPIFIDNRESITNLIDTDSQVINLKVTNDEKLRIVGEEN